jgi:hypothetical protein
MADAEMKDISKEETKVAAPEEQEPNDQFYGKCQPKLLTNPLSELKKNLVLLEKAARDKDHKMVATLTK